MTVNKGCGMNNLLNVLLLELTASS